MLLLKKNMNSIIIVNAVFLSNYSTGSWSLFFAIYADIKIFALEQLWHV